VKKEEPFGKKKSIVFGKSKTKSNPSMLEAFAKTKPIMSSEVLPFSPFKTMNEKDLEKNAFRRTTTMSANKKVKITNTIAEVSDRASSISTKSPIFPFEFNQTIPPNVQPAKTEV